MKNSLHIFAQVLVFLMAACAPDEREETEMIKPVAVAGNQQLTREDLKDLFIDTGDRNDSAVMRKRAIENWAVDALFYQEAIARLTEDEVQIEKQVEDYKRSLVNYIYQTRIIEANLDTNVSAAEIEEYYNENKDNFILKDHIVKVNYFKIPLKAQALEKMKKLFYAVSPKDKEQLQDLCVQYADNYFLNDSTWLYLDDVKKEIPKLRDQEDFNIYQGKVVELTDDLFYYYLRIKEIKVKNSVSPVNFEKQNIRNLIINRRKTQLIRQYKQQLLEKAAAEKRFVIH